MKENIPNLVGFKISRPFLNSILNFGTFLGSFDQLKSCFYQHDSYKVAGIRVRTDVDAMNGPLDGSVK